MILTFRNINPCLLVDKLANKYSADYVNENIIVKNDCEVGKKIANNVTVICQDKDVDFIKNTVESLENDIEITT